MKFDYREYLSRVPGKAEYRLILRPVIPVRIIGPTAEARCDALVDTGADETVLPICLAELLGVSLDQDFTGQAAGIGGTRLHVRYGDIVFELSDGRKALRWATSAGFVEFPSPDDELVILGHGGFLDYFTATFDGESATVELLPNAMLPSSESTS